MSNEIASMRMDQSKPFLCSVCGKDMVNPRTGAAFIGIHLECLIDEDNTEDLEFYEKQLGAYVGLKAAVCWECWFKSMGIPVPDQTFEVS